MVGRGSVLGGKLGGYKISQIKFVIDVYMDGEMISCKIGGLICPKSP